METLSSSMAFCAMVFLGGMQRKIPIMFFPFMVLCCLILGAYVGAYFHVLDFFKNLFLYGGVLAAGVSCFFLLKKRKNFFQDKAWLEGFCGFIIFCLLVLFYNWYYMGSRITHWDEFFHAAFVKALFYEQGFWTLETALARSEVSMTYPPMTSLLAWLFLPSNQYVESAFGVSCMIFFLSCACVLYYLARQKLDILTSILLTFTMTVFMRVIGTNVAEFYLPAYVDGIQGGLFALLLCMIFYLRTQRQLAILFFLGLMLLGLCKSTGIVLCLYVSGALALQQLIYHEKPKAFLSAVKSFSIAFAVSLVPYICWKMYVKEYFAGVEQTGAMLNFSKYIADPTFWPALQAQFVAFFDQELIRTPSGFLAEIITSAFAFIVCIALGLFWARSHARVWYTSFIWHFPLFLLGFAAWVGLHFYAFFVYNSWEIIIKADSFNRYAGAFINGMWAVFLLLIFSYAIYAKYQKTILAIVSVALALLTFFPLERPVHAKIPQIVTQMQEAAAYVKKHTPPHSLIIFVPDIIEFQESWALRYYLAPQRKGFYPYMHTYKITEQRHAVQARPLPDKAAFMQDVKKHGGQYIFVYSHDILEQYKDYFLCKGQEVPCIYPVE